MLEFKKVKLEDLETIKKYVKKQTFRSCDYTVFGIFLWSDYYNYSYCVQDDTFFLRGCSVDKYCNFAVPFGNLTVTQALDRIREYSATINQIPRFYFIPEPALMYFENADTHVLEGWADYIYLAEDLKTLKGHKFNKKRNRLNKFLKSYQNISFETITENNIEVAKAFFEEYLVNYAKDDEYFEMESNLIKKALQMFFVLDQVGGLLFVDGKAVAMSIGEIIDDTLYVHVEKALRNYDGVYEAINYYFANRFADESVKYINREEDMGDEGLRQTKMAYNPVFVQNKYEIKLR